ncbi:MAG: hypothetical protein ABFS35_23110 [Bacteroidota bacterium]
MLIFIMKINKGEDFKQNEVVHDKNRFQNKDLSLLRYNIYSQCLSESLLNEPVAEIQIQNPKMGAVWEDVSVTI